METQNSKAPVATAPVVIVGGGIAGLSAAHFLAQSGVPFLLLESSDRLGGAIRTHREDSYSMEMGPFAFLPKARILPKLVEEWGIVDQLVEADPTAARNRYVFKNGKLYRAPLSAKEFLFSPLLSCPEKLRMMCEPWAKGPPDYEETIAEFVTRRAGRGVLDNLIQPFVSGVVAGDAEKISMSAAFPLFVELENQYGSLIRAMRKRKSQSNSQSTLFSFKQGMQTLSEAFAKKYAGKFRLEATVTELQKKDRGVVVRWQQNGALQSTEAPAVLLATPAPASGRLLKNLNSKLGCLLESIIYTPMMLVHTVYDRKQCPHPIRGFGFLSTRANSISVIGSIWGSSVFPKRCPNEEVLLTWFFGGMNHPQAVEATEDQCLHWVQRAAETALKLKEKPKRFWICRHSQAIPQYLLGHADKIRQISAEARNVGRIYLAGNYFSGVSLEDTAQHSERIVATLLGDLEL